MGKKKEKKLKCIVCKKKLEKKYEGWCMHHQCFVELFGDM